MVASTAHYAVLSTEQRFCLVRGYNGGATEKLQYCTAATTIYTSEGNKVLLVAANILYSDNPAHKSVVCPYHLATNGWAGALNLAAKGVSKGPHTLGYQRRGRNVGLITSLPSATDIRDLPRVSLVSGYYDKKNALSKFSLSDLTNDLADIHALTMPDAKNDEVIVLNCDLMHAELRRITITSNHWLVSNATDDADCPRIGETDTANNADQAEIDKVVTFAPHVDKVSVDSHLTPDEERTASSRVLRSRSNSTNLLPIDPATFAYPSAEVLKHIANSSTHFGVRSKSNPLHHYYPNTHAMSHGLNENVATDTCFFAAKGNTSVEGWNCAQLFVLSGSGKRRKGLRKRPSGYIWVKGMRNKSAASVSHAARRFIANVGVPADCYRADGSQEQNGKLWMEMLDEYFTADNENSEAGNSRQSTAEAYIGVLKSMIEKIMFNFRLDNVPWPQEEWFSLLCYCVDIYNITPRRSLDWRTPTEVAFGQTPDRSGLWTPYFSEVAFVDPRVTFPNNKFVIARSLGMSHNHGNYLCTVLRLPSGKRLHRSAVATTAELRKSRRDVVFTDAEGLEQYEDPHLNLLDHPLHNDDQNHVQHDPNAEGGEEEGEEVHRQADGVAATKNRNNDYEADAGDIGDASLLGRTFILESPVTNKPAKGKVVERKQQGLNVVYEVEFQDGHRCQMSRADLEGGNDPEHWHFNAIVNHEVHNPPKGHRKGDWLMLAVDWGEDSFGKRYPVTLERYEEMKKENAQAVAEYFTSAMNIATAANTGGVVHKAYLWALAYIDYNNPETQHEAIGHINLLKRHGLIDEREFTANYPNPWLAGKQATLSNWRSHNPLKTPNSGTGTREAYYPQGGSADRQGTSETEQTNYPQGGSVAPDSPKGRSVAHLRMIETEKTNYPQGGSVAPDSPKGGSVAHLMMIETEKTNYPQGGSVAPDSPKGVSVAHPEIQEPGAEESRLRKRARTSGKRNRKTKIVRSKTRQSNLKHQEQKAADNAKMTRAQKRMAYEQRYRDRARIDLTIASDDDKRKRIPMMYGVRVPRNIAEAATEDEYYDIHDELSRATGNLRWRDAIKKEIDKLVEYRCFAVSDRVTPEMQEQHYQYLRYTWVFTVKPGGRELKARLVARGDTVNAEGVDSYFSVVETMATRIAMTAAHRDGQLTVTADVTNAYITADVSMQERVYLRAGPEFVELEGKVLRVRKALYGLTGSGKAYWRMNANILRRLNWVPTTGDQNVWMKPDVDGKHWARLVCYVDDMQLHSVNPDIFMEELSQLIDFKFISYNVPRYLGNDTSRQQDGTTLLSSQTYIKEVLMKIAGEHSHKLGGTGKGGAGIRKATSPPYSIKVDDEGLPARMGDMPTLEDDNPDMEISEPLDEPGKRYYQVLCGSLQWVCNLGRWDMIYATSILARYASQPQRHHMDRLLRAWGYLRKFPCKAIRINGSDPTGLPSFDEKLAEALRRDHYEDAKEEYAKGGPTPKGLPLKVSIYCDSDWAGNASDRRSRTGILLFCGSTPVHAKSIKQTGVQTSSYGAELAALKTATEILTGVRHLCRSFGIPIQGSSPAYGDNLGVLTSVTNHSTLLKAKHVSIAWHYVRAAIAAGIVSPRKVWSAANPSDLMTKAVARHTFTSLVNSFMTST